MWITAWVLLSISVILCNKYLLSKTPFKFPVALTVLHMVFNWAITFAMAQSGLTKVVDIELPVYIRFIIPVAALFALSIWLSNVAYCFLSVSFVQMLKAAAPMVMYAASVAFSLEAFQWSTTGIMTVVVGGVAAASIGEVEFNMLGVAANLGSIVAEVMRLVLLQKLSQQRGLRCDPLSSLYHISPISALFLVPLLLTLELRQLIALPLASWPLKSLCFSCVIAFALNLTMYGVIGCTSAVAMKMAGVVKDCMLVACSVMIYRSPVTMTQCLGYSVALVGVMVYTHRNQQQKVIAASVAGSSSIREPALQNGKVSAVKVVVVDYAEDESSEREKEADLKMPLLLDQATGAEKALRHSKHIVKQAHGDHSVSVHNPLLVQRSSTVAGA